MNELTDTEVQSRPPAEELITIARIARPQGVRGEVIADLLTDFPERFAELETVRAVRPNGETRALKLERSRLHQGRIVLKFAGYETVERADELRDARIVIERSRLMELPEDNWYEFELVDCEVVTAAGETLGRVSSIDNFGAAPLLNVQGAGREYLIPLALDICKEIDTTRKRIVIDPPEGLLDL